jgi:hypothetical protein
LSEGKSLATRAGTSPRRPLVVQEADSFSLSMEQQQIGVAPNDRRYRMPARELRSVRRCWQRKVRLALRNPAWSHDLRTVGDLMQIASFGFILGFLRTGE